MILNSEKIREACKTILMAIDNTDKSEFSEVMEIEASDRTLTMNVTNREYFTTIRFTVEDTDNFKVTVNAKLFLNLISKITTNNVELVIHGNSLRVIANGTYNIPLTTLSGEAFELPRIKMTNITNSFNVDGEVLASIALYNSKEFDRGLVNSSTEVKQCCYIDEIGAVTATTGACVNMFNLPVPIKLLLHKKETKLLRLFKAGDNVSVSISQEDNGGRVQTVVKFATPFTELTSILPDMSLISVFNVDGARKLYDKVYPYNISVNKDHMLQAINRIMLFSSDSASFGKMYFQDNKLTISDIDGNCFEEIVVNNDCGNSTKYEMCVNLKNIRSIIDDKLETDVSISFGDHVSIGFRKVNLADFIPEAKIN